MIEALLQGFDPTIEVKFDDTRQRLMAVWGTLQVKGQMIKLARS